MGAQKKKQPYISKTYAVFISRTDDKGPSTNQLEAKMFKDGFATNDAAEIYLHEKALEGSHVWNWFILPVYKKVY